MLELLPDREERLSLHPDDLISLKEAGIRGGVLAMRELDADNLESLERSDPATWPPIKVTLSTRGYIVIDGYHRWEIAKRHQMRLGATCIPYPDEHAVVEAAFRANLWHGLRSSRENRSDYAYWLHLTYPQMEQSEIAERVGVQQSTVSRAIARREEVLRQAREAQETSISEEARRQQQITKSCKSFTRGALRFLREADGLEDAELLQVLKTVVKKREDKAQLARIGRLLNGESPLRLRQFASASSKDPPVMPSDWAQS
jgi:DNA-binding MarR family transcriptional regulator